MENSKIAISQKIRLISLLSVIVFSFIACDSEKSVPDKSDWGLEFFPLEGNSYRVYDVSIISYSILGENDSINYLLKEVVADSFLNLNNEYTFVLNRYKKNKLDSDWRLDSVWAAIKSDDKAVVIENNVPFIKMVFPVRENKQWDGNKMNSKEEEKYTMGEMGKGFQIGETIFPSTVTVLHMDNPDVILVRDKRWEVYSKDIGLIYSEKIQLKYCSDLSCIGEGKIDSGTKYRQELIAYGKE